MIQLYLAMSLEGFISGAGDFSRYGVTGQVVRALLSAGAVIAGRLTYELAGHRRGDR